MCKQCDKMGPHCPWTLPKSFADHCDTIRRRSYESRVTWGGGNNDLWLQEGTSCIGCQEDKEPNRLDAGRRPGTTKPGKTAVNPAIRAKPVPWCALTTFLTAICACPSFPTDLKKEPKVPRASSISWFDRSPGPANSTEQLFFALLVLNSSTQVKDLDAWAEEVLKHEKAYVQEGSAWKIPAEWKPKGSQHAPVMKLLLDAHSFSGENFTLDHIGMVMQVWRGPGSQLLAYTQLRQHFKWSHDSKVKKAGTATARVRDSIIGVASLVKRSGVALRKLLHAPQEQQPTAVEVIARLQGALAEKSEEVASKDKEVAAAKKKAATAENNHYQSAKRLKLKSKAVTDARKAERKKAKVTAQAERKSRLAQAKAARIRDAAIYKAAAEREVAGDVKELKKKVAAARKRARDVADVAKLAGKRLKRAKAAEKALDELQGLLEQVQEPEEESEEEEEQPGTSEGSRRDARGRWLAEAWKLRVLKWAQLARRTPPSAVARNISDVLAAVGAPQSYDPTDRQLQLMRGELTIAGEAMAAFRFGKARRIISFGFDESTKFGKGILSTNTQLELVDGTRVDVVLRGASLTSGGTSEVCCNCHTVALHCSTVPYRNVPFHTVQ